MTIRDALNGMSRREREARMARRFGIGIASLCAAAIAFLAVLAVDAAHAGSPDAVMACAFLSFLCLGLGFLALIAGDFLD